MIEYLKNENKLILSGELLFKNAIESLQQWEQLKEHIHSQLTLDCSNISKADSSFLAILIEIRCWAHKQNLPFIIHQLPNFLKNFLTVYGIEELLMTRLINGSIGPASFTSAV